MNYRYVAYNRFGDLIADSYTLSCLFARLKALGYDEDECVIGRASA